jgi:hypothetical protein
LVLRSSGIVSISWSLATIVSVAFSSSSSNHSFHRTTTSPPTDPLDALSLRTYLSSALTQFLGLTGSATPVDILKLEGQEAWIRVPSEEVKLVQAAVSSWVGGSEDEQRQLRVRGVGGWLGALVGNRSEERLWQ